MIKKLLLITIIILCLSTPTIAKGKPKSSSHFTPQLAKLICQVSAKYNLDVKLLLAIVRQESGFNRLATSNKGAKGLTQMISATAHRFGIIDPYNAEESLHGGCRYLVYLLKRYDGNLPLVLAAYNAGEGAVDRYGKKVPPFEETRNYVRAIMAAYQRSLNIPTDNAMNRSFSFKEKQKLLRKLDTPDNSNWR